VALSKPPVHRSQQFARFLHLALVAPEPREALRLRFRKILLWRKQRYFPSDAADFGLAPHFPACLYNCCRFINAPPGAYELADFGISVSK
jgi:hypothetical protein